MNESALVDARVEQLSSCCSFESHKTNKTNKLINKAAYIGITYYSGI